MRTPIRHSMFDSCVYDVAPGNVSSVFHCVNRDTKDTFIVMCGLTIVAKEGQEIERNELGEAEAAAALQEMSSIPYMIDFDIPVAKVVCGDMFAGLLTCEGTVFTWGYNNYGQLGLKQSATRVVQRPNQIKFENKGKQMQVKDLCVGFNHGMALTDNNQVFVWGRRMGIYPNIELSFNFLTTHARLLYMENHQSEPRLLGNNLIFYKIKKLCAGPWNSALITEQN